MLARSTMLRRIKGITLKDKVRSAETRREIGVTEIVEKVRETRMRWYGHVQRMENTDEVKTTMEKAVQGRRRRRRPRKRWIDCIRKDLKDLRLDPEDALDRSFWRARIRAADPT